MTERRKDPSSEEIQKMLCWLLAGSIWWLCAHTMTLLFPLPGPWIPAGVGMSTGLLMGLVGFVLPSLGFQRWLFRVVGLISGAYLGWRYARGNPAGAKAFEPAGTDELALAVGVCALLGIAANSAVQWQIRRAGYRPLALLTQLLALLGLMLAAVGLLLLL